MISKTIWCRGTLFSDKPKWLVRALKILKTTLTKVVRIENHFKNGSNQSGEKYFEFHQGSTLW